MQMDWSIFQRYAQSLKTKQIEVCYHHFRGHIEEGKIKTMSVAITCQIYYQICFGH